MIENWLIEIKRLRLGNPNPAFADHAIRDEISVGAALLTEDVPTKVKTLLQKASEVGDHAGS